MSDNESVESSGSGEVQESGTGGAMAGPPPITRQQYLAARMSELAKQGIKGGSAMTQAHAEYTAKYGTQPRKTEKKKKPRVSDEFRHSRRRTMNVTSTHDDLVRTRKHLSDLVKRVAGGDFDGRPEDAFAEGAMLPLIALRSSTKDPTGQEILDEIRQKIIPTAGSTGATSLANDRTIASAQGGAIASAQGASSDDDDADVADASGAGFIGDILGSIF